LAQHPNLPAAPPAGHHCDAPGLKGSPLWSTMRQFLFKLSGGPGFGTRGRPCASQQQRQRVGVAVRAFFLARFALALGRYLPTTRLITMAAMPASTALAIGDDKMSVIGLADACC
jgi:hypothetical protein